MPRLCKTNIPTGRYCIIPCCRSAYAVVHAIGHTMGFSIYVTALVHRFGLEGCKEPVEARKQTYIDKIIYWKQNHKEYLGAWPDFMLKG